MIRNRLLKILASSLCCSILVGGCTFLKTEQTQAPGGGVKLKWVFPATLKQKDANLVWTEFNAKLQEKMPNVSVEFEQIALADFTEKWKLMSAAGEKLDIAWSGWDPPYIEEVEKGSYLPLDDLLDDYAPELKAELPSWVWDKQRVEGVIYSIPNYQMLTRMKYGLRTQKELADKYMDIEKVERVFAENPTTNQACYDVLSEYLAKLKENDALGKGVSVETLGWIVLRGFEKITANATIRIDDPELKVYDELEIPEFNLQMEVMRDWFEKGYIRKDILSLQNPREDEGKADGYVLWVHNNLEGEAERETKKNGFETAVVSLETSDYVAAGAISNSTTIPRTAQDPETSIKFLQLINTEEGKELYNLLVYGLEGKHYNRISDERIETIGYSGTPTSESDYGLFKWAMGNTFNSYLTQADPDGWNDYLRDVNDKAVVSSFNGFVLDTTPIKLELAQYSAVEKEFDTLKKGAMANYQELLAQRNEKFKKSGSDKIIEEAQRQIDEWKASQ